MTIDGKSLSKILNTRDAGKHIGLSKSCLEKWRLKNVGPKWIVLGTYCIRYRVSDLEDWLREQTRGGGKGQPASPASETTQAAA